MKNLTKIKLKKINKVLKYAGLQFAVRYDPSERKDSFLLLNWIGRDLVKNYIEEKISVLTETTIEKIMTFIDNKINEKHE